MNQENAASATRSLHFLRHKLLENPHQTKLNAQRSGYSPFFGITCVMLAPVSTLDSFCYPLYRRLAADPRVTKCMNLLPPSSYHITLRGLESKLQVLLNQETGTATEAEAVETAASSLARTLSFCQQELDADFATSKRLVFKVRAQTRAGTVSMEPIESNVESRLRSSEIKLQLALGLPETLQQWHLTLGYDKTSDEGIKYEAKQAIDEAFMQLITPGELCKISMKRFSFLARYIGATDLVPSQERSIGTHVDPATGLPQMVDISSKAPTNRNAVAQSSLFLPKAVTEVVMPPLVGAGKAEPTETMQELTSDYSGKKGPILATSTVAGTMAVKNCSNLIPFCHPLPIERCKFKYFYSLLPHVDGMNIFVECEVGTTHKTGVEMEALAGASACTLTLYDMLKGIEGAQPEMEILHTRLRSKMGGKHGLIK